MKKIVIFVLMLCMVLSLSACGNNEITMQKIYDASQTEAMLKNHQSVYVVEEMDGEVFWEKYLTKDYSYYFIPGTDYEFAEFMTDDANYCYSDGDYLCYLSITPDGASDFANYRKEGYESLLISSDSLNETIESVSEKDGLIVVKSFLSQEVLDEMADYGIASGNFEYVLDAKTHELISATGDCSYLDGQVSHIVSEISYNADEPEMIKTFWDYINQTENLRNVTIVNNPGTDKEESISVQAPKGVIIGFRYEEDSEYEYEFVLYTDADCTELYDPYADTDSDLTVYVKWN